MLSRVMSRRLRGRVGWGLHQRGVWVGPSRDAEKPVVERTFQVEGQPGQRLEVGTKRQGGWEGRRDDGRRDPRGGPGWPGERDTGGFPAGDDAVHALAHRNLPSPSA